MCVYVHIHPSFSSWSDFFPSRSIPVYRVCMRGGRKKTKRRKKILSGRSISPLRFVKYFCLPALCYTVQFARVPVIWRTGGISPSPFSFFTFLSCFCYISKWILDGWKIDMDIELPNFAPPSRARHYFSFNLVDYLFIYLFFASFVPASTRVI